MRDSLIDLAGLNVAAEDFLGAVLQAAAQPVWVVDPDGVIRFANPAALAALGYDSAVELSGRGSHESIHHHHPDGTPYPAADCRMLLPRTTGEVIESELDWFFRRDGSMFAVSYVSVPLEMAEGRGAVVAFSDIEDRLRVERVLRDHEEVLATQQTSLRRVATLVAAGAASEDVFSGIAAEVAGLLGLATVVIWRYEPDGRASVLANWSDRLHGFQTGSRWPLDGPSAAALVLQTGRPVRIEDYENVRSTISDAVREAGMTSAAAAPIVVDGHIWGSISTGQIGYRPLPDRIEDRLADFTELVAAAISNTSSREELALLAAEQGALRRVATLVAQGVSPADVFAVVAEEVGLLMSSIDITSILRYEPDGTATVIATWREGGEDVIPIGTRLALDGESARTTVLRSGRPVRIDWEEGTGSFAAIARKVGVLSGVAAPIVVNDRLWGRIGAGSTQPEPLPIGTELRLAKFTELVATAIANTDSRAELTASRARIVAAGDETRRRLERDLHDGVQQRLVSLALRLRMATSTLPPEVDEPRRRIGRIEGELYQVVDDVREISRGIHPAILSEGGLKPALKTLARRSAIPVELTQFGSDRRLPETVEVACYYVVSEALTNAAKHAHASVVHVDVNADDSNVQLSIRDDGVGGADLNQGSGLVGLGDRVEALGGRIEVDSPAGGGTSLLVRIPIGGHPSAPRGDGGARE
jgi:PAS domain S-box-containing protein